jgi:hypothetical protein
MTPLGEMRTVEEAMKVLSAAAPVWNWRVVGVDEDMTR